MNLITLEELFQYLHVTDSVRERISGFYPDGRYEEGCRLRGYFRKPVSWRRVKARQKLGRVTYDRARLPGGWIYGACGGPPITPKTIERILNWERERRQFIGRRRRS